MAMNEVIRYILQGFNYMLFMLIVWYFSAQPAYRQLEEGQAVVTLAFAHAAKLKEECRVRTQEELNKMPPNMRLPTDCPRERSPVSIEMYLDDELIMKKVLDAPGFHQDQGVDLFHRVKVPAGNHRLIVLMNDDIKAKAPTYQYRQTVTLSPEQQLLVNFDASAGGFYTH
jgi:hypothetical protein